MSLHLEYDSIIRKVAVSSKGVENRFAIFVTNTSSKLAEYKELEQELNRLKDKLIKTEVEKDNLSRRLHTAQNLIDTETNKRKIIEEEKFELERQVSLVVEMLGKNNLNNEAKEKLQILSSTLNAGFGRTADSPFHLSAINEQVSTLGSIMDGLDVDMTEVDDLELHGRTRSGQFYLVSPSQSTSKRKSSPDRSRSTSSKKRRSSRKKCEADKENYVNNNEATTANKSNKIGIDSAKSKSVIGDREAFQSRLVNTPCPSAPPMSTDDEYHRDTTGVSLRAQHKQPQNTNTITGYYNTPLKNYNNCRPSYQIVSPGSKVLCSSPSASRMNNRVHDFVSKTIYWTEHCQPCGKKIMFGKSVMKCRDCRAVCHADCKNMVPLPCIPTTGTPGAKRNAMYLSDYAPQVNPQVPAIVVHCSNEIEKRGLTEVGIYRVPGSDKEVKELKDLFLRGKGSPNLSTADIHAVAGCLKLFLRSLKEPLISLALWRDFVFGAEKHDVHESEACLYQAISDLPQPNRDTLAWMIVHLRRVSESRECRMSVSNLCKVFGPTIVGYSVVDPQPPTILEETKNQQKVMEKLMDLPLDYWDRYLLIDDTGGFVPHPIIEHYPPPIITKKRKSLTHITPMKTRSSSVSRRKY